VERNRREGWRGYKGDGLGVTPTGSGARLRCVFQRLDGEATPEGLWLTSTVTNTVSERFRVRAMETGRVEKEFQPTNRPLFPPGGAMAWLGRSLALPSPGNVEEREKAQERPGAS
jgi:hypothetical protein